MTKIQNAEQMFSDVRAKTCMFQLYVRSYMYLNLVDKILLFKKTGQKYKTL